MTTAVHFPNIARSQSPNSKLNIASIGTQGRAAANLAGVVGENIVALADVDSKNLNAALEKYPDAKGYRDFREMLAAEGDRIDAVIVSTPDHTHAVAAAMALRMGKHLYCEKPLTHTVEEARLLRQLARENNCVTQMGTQIHAGNNYRRVVELIRAGAIGDVDEVHVFVNVGHKYSGGRYRGRPVPDHLDWDLWLGPVFERPYSDGIHPFDWRQFWDFGNGRLGDFGCHYLDLVHWAFDLKQAKRVEAQGPVADPFSTPPWLMVNYEYERPAGQKPLRVTWYGSLKPTPFTKLRDASGNPFNWESGHVFVGSEGTLLSDYSRHHLLPVEQFASYERPEPTIPNSIGHHEEWIQAIKNGGTTTCHFDYAAPLTESVLLGSVAYRSGESLEYDGATGQLKEPGRAGAMLHREYRNGWQL